MNIRDLRNTAPKHRSVRTTYRDVSGIWRIVLHHGMTRRGLGGTNYEAYLRYHVNVNGWSVGGYTYGVEPDGTVKQGYDLNVQTPHVGNYNRRSLGIVLPGDFRYEDPTDAQYDSAVKLVQYLLDLPELSNVKEVIGHTEVPGYSWKNCPGTRFDMDAFRRDIERRDVRAKANVMYGDNQVEAFIESGRTYAQMRELADLVGAKVGWNPNTREATLNGRVVDGQVIDGRTYLPVRQLAEDLGLNVGWDQRTFTVTLTK